MAVVVLGNWYGATRQIRSRGNSSLPSCSRLGAAYRRSVPSSATRASWVGRRPPPPPPRSNLRRMGKEEGKLARFSLPPPHQPSSLIVSRNDLLLRIRSGEEGGGKILSPAPYAAYYCIPSGDEASHVSVFPFLFPILLPRFSSFSE